MLKVFIKDEHCSNSTGQCSIQMWPSCITTWFICDDWYTEFQCRVPQIVTLCSTQLPTGIELKLKGWCNARAKGTANRETLSILGQTVLLCAGVLHFWRKSRVMIETPANCCKEVVWYAIDPITWWQLHYCTSADEQDQPACSHCVANVQPWRLFLDALDNPFAVFNSLYTSL